MQFRATNIKWERNDDELPEAVVIPIEIVEERVSEYLTDGWVSKPASFVIEVKQ